jgi:hypothetical protein
MLLTSAAAKIGKRGRESGLTIGMPERELGLHDQTTKPDR